MEKIGVQKLPYQGEWCPRGDKKPIRQLDRQNSH